MNLANEKENHDVANKNNISRELSKADKDLLKNTGSNKQYELFIPLESELGDLDKFGQMYEKKTQVTVSNEKDFKKNLVGHGHKKNKYSNVDLIDIDKVLCRDIMVNVDPST